MRKLIVSIVVAAAGGLAIPGQADAACKSVTNVYKDKYFNAQVVTNWCYGGGNVTSRSSLPTASVTDFGYASGFRESDAEWKYSACHSYNGYAKHNCLTKRQFSYTYRYGPDVGKIGVCISTRVYGNGAHRRDITTNC